MPVYMLNEGDGTFEDQIPCNLQRIHLHELTLDTSLVDKYIKGTILLKYLPHRLGDGEEIIKMILEEHVEQRNASGTATINVFFFGKLSKDCADRVQQTNTVVITGFDLKMSPTASKDGRHICQLELSETIGAKVYVCNKSAPRTPGNPVKTSDKRSASLKYTYTPLNKLKEGTIVCVYGVVKFFKAPYRSKGTDYCSVVTIMDQSNKRVTCTLFSGDEDTLPKIYKAGDIVRFHRLKIQAFRNEIQGITSMGFSALTFDGTVGAPIIPRTSSKSYNFTSEEHKIVEELRSWAATNLSFSTATVKLRDVQPMQFFDLTCQLVAKAPVDRSSVVLKVWDGTKCLYPAWKAFVGQAAVKGDPALIYQLQNLTVDILVYDNHIDVAKSLKPGAYLQIYNLHSKPHSTSQQIRDKSTSDLHLEFHLHGGTSFGRGIRVLSQNSEDVKELQRSLESVDVHEFQYLEDMALGGEDDFLKERPYQGEKLHVILERCQQKSATVLTAHQHVQFSSLDAVLKHTAPHKFCIRAKIKTYVPQNLFQCVKLYCPKCHSLQEVPDEETLALQFSDSAADHSNFQTPSTPWFKTHVLGSGEQGTRQVIIHFMIEEEMQTPEDSLILVEGATLRELYKLSDTFNCVIPVTSDHESLTLKGLSVPFLIQEKSCYYGCSACSNPKTMNDLRPLTEQNSWNAPIIAKALGIQPLQYSFLMKFTLDDETGSLDVLLWDDAEKFFQFSAAEVVHHEAFQEQLQMVMDRLCPGGTSIDDRPWLECCIKSYHIKNGSDLQINYQMFDTTVAEE
ncbi:protection of telomeres protein 1 isoform X1 [Latimeria chalumnae]|uniref:Protection of telomeres protein 1 n=2 Tax=Latimeria chalumnae TaxID=7897 RepID=H3ABF4_LATCH|nr:PREDICTED: protection of telomeres protein 1 isoform X3 [Latimeria chalumnae]XP_006008351.1 PREDICTED: protection of telomeres protein 1 isoform X3 [Latimeria chalumnae]XP_006008352.1 PREDICTED: protection of telomeres protein 1 isoform X3 [Latimeria chalumnae]XP_014351464.1 PREDICTED: protection of telomeres protein 1 isoform X3 [Latimeria chalumnae]|eukprot:XP_006008350.1 PREDICTED: protection of telomeres protein 1 isoform X3 [Latimeria chalumnae]